MAVLNTLEPYGELKENVLMPGTFPSRVCVWGGGE